jgi:hypothetical protein
MALGVGKRGPHPCEAVLAAPPIHRYDRTFGGSFRREELHTIALECHPRVSSRLMSVGRTDLVAVRTKKQVRENMLR